MRIPCWYNEKVTKLWDGNTIPKKEGDSYCFLLFNTTICVLIQKYAEPDSGVSAMFTFCMQKNLASKRIPDIYSCIF